jgi:hypothetical protein
VNREKSFDSIGFEATGVPSEQQCICGDKSIKNNNFLLLQRRETVPVSHATMLPKKFGN